MISPSRALLLWAARLYPKAWRARYGDEFAAMIEDLPAGRARWATVGDILRGALVMRVRRSVMGMTVTGGLAGLVIAAGVGLAIPNHYHTVALVQAGNGVTDAVLSAAVERALEPEKLRGLIGKYGLYANGPDAEERMQRDVAIVMMHRRADGSRGVRIGFGHRVPETARQVAMALTAALLEAQPGLTLVDAPGLPQSPIFPNRTTISLLGVAVGLAMGLGFGYLQPKAKQL